MNSSLFPKLEMIYMHICPQKFHYSLCIFPSSYKPFSFVNHRMMRCSLWDGYQIIVAQAWCKLTNHALVMSRLLIYYVMLEISNILKLRFWNIETMFQIIQDISSKNLKNSIINVSMLWNKYNFFMYDFLCGLLWYLRQYVSCVY